MATVRREILVAVAPSRVWEAIRDIGAAHVRLFPGILLDVRRDADGRTATFASGLVVRELTVELNDDLRRYAWAASGGGATHHNASLQVFEAQDGGSRIVWVTEFLPDEIHAAIEALIDAGAAVMRATLESDARASASS